jgi:hypothetical protein
MTAYSEGRPLVSLGVEAEVVVAGLVMAAVVVVHALAGNGQIMKPWGCLQG